MSPSATLAADHARGQESLVVMTARRRQLGGRIAQRLGDAELATNVPVLVLCELALRGPLRPRDLLDAAQLTSGGMTKRLDHLESRRATAAAIGAHAA